MKPLALPPHARPSPASRISSAQGSSDPSMRSSNVLLSLLVAAACSCGGCAVTTGALYAMDSRPFTGRFERVEPLGPMQRTVSISAVSFDPLQISCVTEERRARERVHETHVGIDVGGRLAYGLIAAGETVLAAGPIGAVLENEEPRDYVLLAIASVIGLDALATWILTFALPDFREERTFEREGRVVARSECPADAVTIEIERRMLAVDSSGRLSAEDEAWLVGALLRGSAPMLVIGGQRTDLSAHVPLCALANRHGHVKPQCPSVPVAPYAPAPLPPLRFELELSL